MRLEMDTALVDVQASCSPNRKDTMNGMQKIASVDYDRLGLVSE